MPRLLRLRYVSVGHPNARLEDVTLNFHDERGQTSDSTLWLRNGGGKSSLLNLFFAVLRPNRQEFLGGKAESKRRRLEDYVQANDRSVVVCEWALDGPTGRLNFESVPDRLVTGVFHEWQGGGRSEDASRLDRLYFAFRVIEDDPRATLDGLPLFIEREQRQAQRRRMVAFQQELQDLRQTRPHSQLVITKNQTEWQRFLEETGIDPELYLYQIHMNRREGGADELFRFDEHEEFVDFLLEMVLDPRLGESIGKNLETFRVELRDRKNRFVPERDLVAGVIERLIPLSGVATRRVEVLGRARTIKKTLQDLHRYVEQSTAALRAEIGEHTAARDRERIAAQAAQVEADQRRRQSAALRRHAARLRQEEATQALEEIRRRHEESNRQKRFWEAAVPLSQALRHERNALKHHQQLEAKQSEFAPQLQELRQTAFALASALTHRCQQVNNQWRESKRRESEAREQARQLHQQAADCQATVATFLAETNRYIELLRVAQVERDRLLENGHLQLDETGEQASLRIQQTLSSLVTQRQQKLDEQSHIQDRITETTEARTSAEREATRAEVNEAAEQKRFVEASDERLKLEQRPILRQSLEVEEVDLERLTEASLQPIQTCLTQLVDRLVLLRVEDVEDERAVLHLQNEGLLPPTRDAEQVLEILRRRLPQSWSGWRYLESNAPLDGPRGAVQRAPHLVLGIVVRDEDFAAAAELIQLTQLHLDTPVVLASQGYVTAEYEHRETSTENLLVLGPTSEAHFDRGAGGRELNRRYIVRERRAGEVSQTERQRSELAELLSQLHSFRERFPQGWFVKQREHIEKERKATHEAQERVQLLTTELEKLGTQQAETADALRTIDLESRACERSLDTVQAFVTQHESRESEIRLACKAATIQVNEQRDRQRQLIEDAIAQEGQAGAEAQQAEEFHWSVASFHHELTEVQYLEGRAIAAQPGPLDQFRDDYRRLKTNYEDKVGSEGLLLLARREEELAAEQRGKAAAQLPDDISEAELEMALGDLPDLGQAQEKSRDANELWSQTFPRLGRQEQNKSNADHKLREAEQHCDELGGIAELSVADAPRSADDADASAVAMAQDAEQFAKRAKDYEEKAHLADTRRSASEGAFTALGKDSMYLQSLTASNQELLATLPADDAALESPARLDADLGDLLSRLDVELRTARDELNKLNAERQDVVRTLRAWLSEPCFQELKSRVTQQLAACDDAELETRIENYLGDLSVRLQTIEEQLRQMDEHRELLVTELMHLANDGLHLLESAARQSSLPENVPGLGGTQFLKIKFDAPAEPEARRDRLRGLIDEIIDQGTLPSGVKLVQQAVRRIARPIRVRMLDPDPDRHHRSVEITELGKFSGGEQQTCAILLYCTLAQLRARQSGKFRQPTSVLLLDNPIGRASRPRFLQLQRDVARAMGVQLIYATAVNDFEALRTMPNLIRLRNERMDRKTGHHVVEVDDFNNQLEAARIVRVGENV